MAARAQAASRSIGELLKARDDIVAELRRDGARGVVLDLANDLIGFPRLDVSTAADRYGVSYPAVNSAVMRMVKLGILREITGGRYGRVFACDRVYEIIAQA